jgi:hypothetical protein
VSDEWTSHPVTPAIDGGIAGVIAEAGTEAEAEGDTAGDVEFLGIHLSIASSPCGIQVFIVAIDLIKYLSSSIKCYVHQ